ncbi:hypothetical protein B0T17DRAFT_502709 [Bombardia bombarda]|uniref:Uncharacterized protein n=1 Tax=Bombardia bombarda TaxID=252184 RepID=A0AA39XJG1_9PEZI|nr:hypothetical protein B0T17DRAFT_502709 [Bombardia bombarda]
MDKPLPPVRGSTHVVRMEERSPVTPVRSGLAPIGYDEHERHTEPRGNILSRRLVETTSPATIYGSPLPRRETARPTRAGEGVGTPALGTPSSFLGEASPWRPRDLTLGFLYFKFSVAYGKDAIDESLLRECIKDTVDLDSTRRTLLRFVYTDFVLWMGANYDEYCDKAAKYEQMVPSRMVMRRFRGADCNSGETKPESYPTCEAGWVTGSATRARLFVECNSRWGREYWIVPESTGR